MKRAQKPEVVFNRDIIAFYQLNCCKTWWTEAWALPSDSRSAALPWNQKEELAPFLFLEGQKLLEDLTVIRWTPPSVSSYMCPHQHLLIIYVVLLLQKDSSSWWLGFPNSSPIIADKLNSRLGKKPMYRWNDDSWEPVTTWGLNIWTPHSFLSVLSLHHPYSFTYVPHESIWLLNKLVSSCYYCNICSSVLRSSVVFQ